jgi:DnaJ-class molecular chaperone
MAANPYQILGVEPKASEHDIRSAYRKLAKKNHPDLNPGNKEAEARFKDIASAYDILSDKEKRAKFDRGEIDASGAERPQQAYGNYRHYAEGQGGARYQNRGFETEGADAESLDDLFSFFGGQGRGGTRSFRRRGEDRHYVLTIDFLDAVKGSKKRLDLPEGKTLDVTIPPGLRDGQILRLEGQGGAGTGNGPFGDALIEVRINPDPLFRRDGDDIRVDLPITLVEAVLGAKVPVPTTDGNVTMTIPPDSNTGRVLRLKGRGLPKPGLKGGRGDQYVTLKIMLPEHRDAELAAFLREWGSKHPYDPRRGT